MGLFAGFSILSAVEVLYFILKFFFSLMSKTRTKIYIQNWFAKCYLSPHFLSLINFLHFTIRHHRNLWRRIYSVRFHIVGSLKWDFCDLNFEIWKVIFLGWTVLHYTKTWKLFYVDWPTFLKTILSDTVWHGSPSLKIFLCQILKALRWHLKTHITASLISN